MPGPWEKYAAQPADGPWAKYATEEDPFAGDALLSNEAMGKLAAGEKSTVPQSPAPSPFRGLTKYAGRVNDAIGRFNQAKPAGIAGSLEALTTLATGGIAAPVLGTVESAVLGTPPEESFARYTYQPRTESGRAQLGVLGAMVSPVTETGLDMALAPLFAGESRAVASAPAKIPPNVRRASPRGDPVPAQPREMAGPDAPGAQVPAASPQAKRPAGLEGVRTPAPSIDELSEAASAAYKRAEDAGVNVSEFSFKKFKGRLLKNLGERVDPTLHPDTTATLKRIFDTKGDLTLEQLENLRRIANDAKASTKPADQRLASKIVDEIDDYVGSLGEGDVISGKVKDIAALKEARDFYSRKMKAQEINGLIERAKLSAPNFSASGLENAIRTEFRNLAKNDKRMKRFTPAERAAIIKVAKGGPVENVLRMIGKLAPRGIVSTALSGGLGMMTAGPAGSALMMGAGELGRFGATRMTMKNALAAEELMRRGPVAPQKIATPPRNALLEY